MEGGDQSCIECEVESVAWIKVVGLAVGLVVFCLLVVAVYLCYQKMAAQGAKKDAGTLRSAYHKLSHPARCGKQQFVSAVHWMIEWLTITRGYLRKPMTVCANDSIKQVGEAQLRCGRRGTPFDLRQGD